jgi:hypothetical protein
MRKLLPIVALAATTLLLVAAALTAMDRVRGESLTVVAPAEPEPSLAATSAALALPPTNSPPPATAEPEPSLTPAEPTPTALPAPTDSAATPTNTRQPGPSPTPSPTPLGVNGLAAETFVVLSPQAREHVQEIYRLGQELGRDSHAFSKLGDSTILKPILLKWFDDGRYDLGPYAYLAPAITYYAGSFARVGVAAKVGLHSWGVFDPFWADERWCEANETILDCEFRYQNPSILIIRLGSNDSGSPSSFDKNLRDVIEFCLENGVIPLLGTKADRFEGDNTNNDLIRAAAADYDLPLWEFDLVAGTIPGRGLDEDGVHLAPSELDHDFTDATTFERGHAVQDLTLLMMIHAIWAELGLADNPTSGANNG